MSDNDFQEEKTPTVFGFQCFDHYPSEADHLDKNTMENLDYSRDQKDTNQFNAVDIGHLDEIGVSKEVECKSPEPNSFNDSNPQNQNLEQVSKQIENFPKDSTRKEAVTNSFIGEAKESQVPLGLCKNSKKISKKKENKKDSDKNIEVTMVRVFYKEGFDLVLAMYPSRQSDFLYGYMVILFSYGLTKDQNKNNYPCRQQPAKQYDYLSTVDTEDQVTLALEKNFFELWEDWFKIISNDASFIDRMGPDVREKVFAAFAKDLQEMNPPLKNLEVLKTFVQKKVKQQQWDELEEPLKQALNLIREQIARNPDNLKDQFAKSRCGDHEEKPLPEEYKKKKKKRYFEKIPTTKEKSDQRKKAQYGKLATKSSQRLKKFSRALSSTASNQTVFHEQGAMDCTRTIMIDLETDTQARKSSVEFHNHNHFNYDPDTLPQDYSNTRSRHLNQIQKPESNHNFRQHCMTNRKDAISFSYEDKLIDDSEMRTPNNAHFRNIQEVGHNSSPDVVDNDYLDFRFQAVPGLVQFDFPLENNCYSESEMQEPFDFVGSYLDLTNGQTRRPESP